MRLQAWLSGLTGAWLGSRLGVNHGNGKVCRLSVNAWAAIRLDGVRCDFVQFLNIL